MNKINALNLMQGLACGVIGACTFGIILVHNLPPVPLLIGHGCMNTNGDIFAMNEDDFPPCEDIERNK